MVSIAVADEDGFRFAQHLLVLLVVLAAFPTVTMASVPTDESIPPASTVATAGGLPGESTLGSAGATERLACVRQFRAGKSPNRLTTPLSSPPTNETRDLAVASGDVAVVPVSVPAGTTATVAVTSGDDYAVRLRVREADGDGQVTLLVNTYLAGNESTVPAGTYSARGEDAVIAVHTNQSAAMNEGEYAVTVRQNESVTDTQQVAVTESSVSGMTARRAAPQVFHASNASEIRSANRSGLIQSLRPGEYNPEVVDGETLLFRIDAPSLLGVLAAKFGTTPTERFVRIHESWDYAAPERFEIFGPCGGIMFIDTAEEGGARVVTDYREGTVYVLLDTSNIEGTDAGKQTAYFGLSAESRINNLDSEREFKAKFGVGNRESTVHPARTDGVRLKPVENASISGETDLLPGSRITINVTLRDDPTYVRRTTTVVDSDGTFDATVDLSERDGADRYDVSITSGEPHGRTVPPVNGSDETYGTPTRNPSTISTTVSSESERTDLAESPTPVTGGSDQTAEAKRTTRDEPTVSSAEGPGFGPAVGVIATICVGILLARRQ